MNKRIGFLVTSFAALLVSTSGLAANDKVDLSRDHLDTIKFVAQEYIKTAFAGKSVNFEAPNINWLSNNKAKAVNGKGEVQEGGYNAVFRVGDGPLQIRKLQLARIDGEWRVVNALSEKQIHAAHLQAAPYRDEPPYIFKAIAARHFEKHYYTQEGGWTKLREPLFYTCLGGNREGQKAHCEVAYGIYYEGDYMLNGSFQHTRCTAKTYLFEKKGDAWVVEQVLPAEKKFDRKTNTVIDRKDEIWGC